MFTGKYWRDKHHSNVSMKFVIRIQKNQPQDFKTFALRFEDFSAIISNLQLGQHKVSQVFETQSQNEPSLRE